ncbi:hypothetical protein [Chryseobacterium sp. BIGb0232]|uniref:hypothetical protein n=1 Tax=Chryseobacterium sp. BIGb0232 TaxID=2940598 RepID=UPI000F47C399|nr:hypothetical protein [Chryseobacterium sp. BIGb0232]MCS4300691.1 hypothetical protein [Chryseobacterium sp. BIGb0232]ROS20429.1 hypothetical protein EDF65_1147 [Chryseobacterium nakagawai]
MNFVTVIYLVNLLLYAIYFFGKGSSEEVITIVDYSISAAMSFFLILAGYVNAKQKMTYRSVLWMFFVNVVFFAMSGLFDQFGNNFNLLSMGNDNFIFTLALIAYNGYLFPLIVKLERTGFSLVLPLVLSFILPSLGYWIGRMIAPKNSTSSEEI